MWAYAEHQLSERRRVLLSPESIIKIDLPTFLTKEGKTCFLIIVAVAKEAVWKARVKRGMTGDFVSSPRLVRYFMFHLKRKLELEKRSLSVKMFKER